MIYAYGVVKFQIINHLSETVQIHTSSPRLILLTILLGIVTIL